MPNQHQQDQDSLGNVNAVVSAILCAWSAANGVKMNPLFQEEDPCRHGNDKDHLQAEARKFDIWDRQPFQYEPEPSAHGLHFKQMHAEENQGMSADSCQRPAFSQLHGEVEYDRACACSGDQRNKAVVHGCRHEIDFRLFEQIQAPQK